MKQNKKEETKIIGIMIFIFVIIGILLVVDKNHKEVANNTYENIKNDTTNSFKYENVNINNEELNIFFLDVGQADSTLITMNSINMLIDTGNKNDGKNIAEFLKAQNIEKLDYLIGTHIDEDHIGGMVTVIQELEIGTIYMPYNKYEKDCYDSIIKIAKDKVGIIEASKDISYLLRKS